MPTAAPLVVFSDTAICDGPVEHEVRLITDGRRAYAYGIHPQGCDAEPWARNGTRVTAVCCQPAPHREECEGIAYFDLSTEGTWTADPEALSLLTVHGTPLED